MYGVLGFWGLHKKTSDNLLIALELMKLSSRFTDFELLSISMCHVNIAEIVSVANVLPACSELVNFAVVYMFVHGIRVADADDEGAVPERAPEGRAEGRRPRDR